MRTPRLLAIPLVFALAACLDDESAVAGPTVVRLDASAVVGASAMARPDGALPIEGRCELTFNPPPLPLPPVHHQVDTGTCWFSHLGRTALYGVQDIVFAAGTQSGERTFTAANGDVLYAVHAGRSAPSGPGVVSFVTTITFVGGTGRFANVTGQMTGAGTANLVTRTTVVTNEGWIAYDASDRAGR
jgi:hypothetical protein